MTGTRAVSFLGPGETDSGAALTEPESGAGSGADRMAGSGEGTEEASGEANSDGGTNALPGGFGASRGW
jgi:hypothetical protein